MTAVEDTVPLGMRGRECCQNGYVAHMQETVSNVRQTPIGLRRLHPFVDPESLEGEVGQGVLYMSM